eukprot:2266677-Rhodomonas_salina.5
MPREYRTSRRESLGPYGTCAPVNRSSTESFKFGSDSDCSETPGVADSRGQYRTSRRGSVLGRCARREPGSVPDIA